MNLKSLTKLYPFLVLILFSGVFFHREIFGQYVFGCCDNLIINAPVKKMVVDSFLSGEMPLWNPYLNIGTPLLADINMAVLSPFTLVYLLTDVFTGLSWSVLIAFLAVSVGMYVFGRSLGLSWQAGILMGVGFAYSGSMIWSSDDVPVTQVLAFLPWVMWGWRVYLKQPKPTHLVLLVCIHALQLLSGHPHIVYMTWGLALTWGLYLSSGFRRFFTLLLPVVLLFLMTTAVQTLPFIEFVWHSSRGVELKEFASSDSFELRSLIRIFWPSWDGSISDSSSWWDEGMILGFVGFGLAGLALAGGLFSGAREKALFAWGSILFFAISLGNMSPLWQIAYSLIPGFSLFRSPQNYLVMFTFCVVVLAGYGFDQVILKRFKPAIRMLFVVLIFCELSLHSWWVLQTVPKSQLNSWLEQSEKMVDSMADFDPRLYRIHVMPSLFTRPNRTQLDVYKTAEWNSSVLWPNIPLLYGLPLTSGTTALTLSVYDEFLNTPVEDVRLPHPRAISLDTLRLFGAQYIVGTPTDDLHHFSVEGGPTLTYEADGYGVYRFNQALPRAFFESGDQAVQYGQASIDEISMNRIVVSTTQPKAGVLVLTDAIYPGWRVFANGVEKSLIDYQNIFKAVLLDPGKNTVEFVYRPLSFYLGAWLSGFGILISFCLLIFKRLWFFDRMR